MTTLFLLAVPFTHQARCRRQTGCEPGEPGACKIQWEPLLPDMTVPVMPVAANSSKALRAGPTFAHDLPPAARRPGATVQSRVMIGI